MSYYGKTYTLVSQENFDKFINSLKDKIPENVKPAVINHKATIKLEQKGDEYVLTNSEPSGGEKATVFKSGVEFDEDVFGNKSKTTFTVEGNVVTQVQNFDEGIKFNIKREFFDDQVVATIQTTTFDGVAKRVFK